MGRVDEEEEEGGEGNISGNTIGRRAKMHVHRSRARHHALTVNSAWGPILQLHSGQTSEICKS